MNNQDILNKIVNNIINSSNNNDPVIELINEYYK